MNKIRLRFKTVITRIINNARLGFLKGRGVPPIPTKTQSDMMELQKAVKLITEGHTVENAIEGMKRIGETLPKLTGNYRK